MSRKVLCHCGAVARIGLLPIARCKACKKLLPITMPRGATYAARTLTKPLLVIAALAILFFAAPLVRTYQQTHANPTSTHSIP